MGNGVIFNNNIVIDLVIVIFIYLLQYLMIKFDFIEYIKQLKVL